MEGGNMHYKIHDLPYNKFIDHAFALAMQDHSFWFDSSSKAEPYGRFSFVGCDPYKIYAPENHKSDIFEILKEDIKYYDVQNSIPFLGGFAGYFSYDFGLKLLDIEPKGDHVTPMADYFGGLYDVCLYADHKYQKSGLIVTDQHPDHSMERRKAYFLSLIEHSFTLRENNISVESLWDKGTYKEAVQKTRHYIENGNIFQANIARYFKGDVPQDFCSLSYYAKLRDINMAPFGCYLKMQDYAIMSSSPERFLKIEGDHIETRPIKGTLSDQFPAKELEKSAKDRAENIMIVDMLRNDLAKTSQAGSVSVPELCITEAYEGLHHLVSTVQSVKDLNIHPIDVFKNAFPGGSITGAPKKHACEIILELEKKRRGGYCGSAGYLSFSGHMDMNILIRTVFSNQKHISFGAGCGITYDSDADAEYDESVLKAQKIIQSFEA